MRIGLIVPLALLAASPLRSQTVVWERLGSGSGASYQGLQTAMYVGDLNGDGFGDLLVRVAYGYTNETFLWFLSGKDGSTLRVRPNVGQGQYYKSFSAAGDVDQDGVADYAVMIDRINAGPLAGDNIVQVCSGRDDSVFWQVEGEWPFFGRSLRGDVDLDGDRIPDLVLTHPRSTPYGRVEAYSSQGRRLWVQQGTPEFYVGWLDRRSTSVGSAISMATAATMSSSAARIQLASATALRCCPAETAACWSLASVTPQPITGGT